MKSGVNILLTLNSKGCVNAKQFANGQPYIEYFDYGPHQGGEWRLYGPDDYRRIIEVKADKESKDVGFLKIKFWMNYQFEIATVDKTPFGTWMEPSFIRERVREILQ